MNHALQVIITVGPAVAAGAAYLRVHRRPGEIELVMPDGVDTDWALGTARSLLNVEERDAVRSYFGVPSIAEAPAASVWSGIPDTVNADWTAPRI